MAISATGNPIHFMFGSRVGFSGTADLMTLFTVRTNPRWRPPSWIISNGHISATDHDSYLYSAHRAVIFAIAQLSCKKDAFDTNNEKLSLWRVRVYRFAKHPRGNLLQRDEKCVRRGYKVLFRYHVGLWSKKMINENLESNRIDADLSMYTVFRKKNTHSHFLSYLNERCADLNKNCSEHT